MRLPPVSARTAACPPTAAPRPPPNPPTTPAHQPAWRPAGSPEGYGPTGLTELQLDELLAAVGAHMDAACSADVTVVRRRKARAARRPGRRRTCHGRRHFLRMLLYHPCMNCASRTLPALPAPQVPAPTLGAPDHAVADVCIRRRAGPAAGGREPLEVRVAICGNVDSGKSTCVSRSMELPRPMTACPCCWGGGQQRSVVGTTGRAVW